MPDAEICNMLLLNGFYIWIKYYKAFCFAQVMFECGKYNLVHEFFRKMDKSSIPNALTYRGIYVIFLSLCSNRYLDTCLIPKVHIISVVEADFGLFSVLVNTLWKEDRIDEAVSVVQVMEKRGIVGSAALYYDLARCLCSAGRCQEALMQVYF